MYQSYYFFNTFGWLSKINGAIPFRGISVVSHRIVATKKNLPLPHTKRIPHAKLIFIKTILSQYMLHLRSTIFLLSACLPTLKVYIYIPLARAEASKETSCSPARSSSLTKVATSRPKRS